MIKFFRRIRQKLLAEKRLGKYLMYALGEIILVVLGILIAVQASNWNDRRKLNNKVAGFYPKLQSQQEGNLSLVQSDLEMINYYFERSNIISNQAIGSQQDVDIKQIDTLVFFTGIDFHLNLNMTTIKEAQINDNLTNIRSDSLRESIYKLIKVNELVIAREQIINEDLAFNLKPFLNKNYNIRNLIHSVGYAGIQPSKIKNDNNLAILQSQEFESLMVTRIMYLEDMVIIYGMLKTALENTLSC